ncbi:MAG: type II toxin-antitoxin system VapC family toxin [Methyloceanibacter sp.]
MVSPAKLRAFLKKHKRVGLDSNILIYFIEAHPRYQAAAQMIFESIEADRNRGICSTLSLLEVLVQPYRNEDDDLTNQFYGLLTSYPNLSWIAVSVEIADLGARLRAQYKLKTPDAILIATAMHAGASGFIGNDAQLARVTELDVLLLNAVSPRPKPSA